MYNPPHFAETRAEVLMPLIRERGFGTLVVCGPDGLDAAHVPMEVDPAAGKLRCHVALPNPIWRSVEASPAVLVIFLGADHYISPTWYPSKAEHGRVVPTWNYEAIHAHGRAVLFEESGRLLEHLTALTSAHEGEFSEPWAVADAPSDFVARQMKGIVGVEIAIERMEGKFKMGQNRSTEDRLGAVAGLEGMGDAASVAVAAAMRGRMDGEPRGRPKADSPIVRG